MISTSSKKKVFILDGLKILFSQIHPEEGSSD